MFAIAGSGGQANGPSRIGVFSWHEDMRKLDARVAGITNRVRSLAGTCLRDGNFRTVKHDIQMLEHRLQAACESMDPHNAYLSTQ